MIPRRPEDLPEWQAAYRDYLSHDGHPDYVMFRRIEAARRIHAVERAWEHPCRRMVMMIRAAFRRQRSSRSAT